MKDYVLAHHTWNPATTSYTALPPRPTRRNFKWALQNLPISFLIFGALSLIVLGFSFLDEDALGYVMIVLGAVGYIYTLVRYVYIGYRMYSKFSDGIKTGILIVFDLKIMEFLTITAIVTGMYMIDTSPGKDTYILHAAFSVSRNIFYVWWYLAASTVSILTGTGYSSIIENALSTATVFSVGIIISEFTTLVILGSLVGYWVAASYESVKNRKEKERRQRVRMAKKRTTSFRVGKGGTRLRASDSSWRSNT